MTVYAATGIKQRQQAYELLALAAAEQWGLFTLPEIVRGRWGKPCFQNLNGHEFNLSHSGSMALCCLDHRCVGVDIQTVQPRRSSLPGRVCSAEQLAWLGQGEGLWIKFSLLWALKECRVKHSGQGLTQPIADIRVPLPKQGQDLIFFDGLWFRIYGNADWQAAVCGQAPPPQAIEWRTLPPAGSLCRSADRISER